MTGKVTIGGKEYRLHYGMHLFEKFQELLQKMGSRQPSFSQILTCVILYGHENWCEVHDQPFELAKPAVVAHIEKANAEKNAAGLDELAKAADEFFASTFIADLVEKGKEVLAEENKKKANPGKPELKPTAN